MVHRFTRDEPTNRSKASIPNANSREASERFAETPREAEIASDLDISVKDGWKSIVSI
jgi:hypothetical protein